LQESGKKKALFDGPWKVNNDLIIMVEFDPTKLVEEYMFDGAVMMMLGNLIAFVDEVK
jgi:hypothetical protein